MAAGGMISAMLTSDPRWMEWHLSRLGEGGHISSYIFNTCSAVCSLLMGTLTAKLLQDIKLVHAPHKAHVAARRLLAVGLFTIAVCMMGVAVFPFDTQPIIHNSFGYTMTVMYIVVIARLPVLLPLFSRLFTACVYLFIAVTFALFTSYFITGGRTPHLLYIEIFGMMFFFAWLIMLTRAIRVHNRVV